MWNDRHGLAMGCCRPPWLRIVVPARQIDVRPCSSRNFGHCWQRSVGGRKGAGPSRQKRGCPWPWLASTVTQWSAAVASSPRRGSRLPAISVMAVEWGQFPWIPSFSSTFNRHLTLWGKSNPSITRLNIRATLWTRFKRSIWPLKGFLKTFLRRLVRSPWMGMLNSTIPRIQISKRA